MLQKKKLVQIAVAVILIALYAISERFPGFNPDQVTSVDNSLLHQVIADRRSDVQVTGSGAVIKLLADDNKGSRHQRFLVKIDSGDVILIAHNIDLAPRVDELRKGDTIRFNGEYEWNNKGGVVHWTHKDPRSKHIHGWLEHDGRKYW
ncbi:MAG: DUF3465 domain-containing protein [bacterium]